MESMNILSSVMEVAERANPAKPGDYGKNGLLYCGACHTPKQSRLNFLGRDVVVSCMCACETERYAQKEAQRRQQEEADRIMRLRSSGIASQEYRNARFELDDRKNPKPMETLRKYADKWEQFQADNIGLLLYGGVGTGKSYGAACIANELIGRNIPACMENLSSIMNTLGGLQGKEKNEYIADLMQYPLLILDDFGMERQTEYALEQVFNIVDARYRSGQPLIVTTNLSLSELQNPPTREHTRIYDRILEMCSPVNFGNNGRRTDAAKDKAKRAAELLRGD